MGKGEITIDIQIQFLMSSAKLLKNFHNCYKKRYGFG